VQTLDLLSLAFVGAVVLDEFDQFVLHFRRLRDFAHFLSVFLKRIKK